MRAHIHTGTYTRVLLEEGKGGEKLQMADVP